MKALVIFLLSLTSVLSIRAQEGHFNFSLGAGIAAPDGIHPALSIEPKFQVSKTVRLGGVGRFTSGDDFQAIFLDANIKTSPNGQFYIGIGVGNIRYEGASVGTISGSGFSFGDPTTENDIGFIPSIGIQGDFDANLSFMIIDEVLGVTFTISRVFGYKKSE